MTVDGKIKILQFPIANSKGGITQYVLQNWKFIDKSKFQFDFATMSKQLDFEEDLTKDSCNVFYISCYAEDDEEQFKKEFRNILEQGEYDIVHLHTKQWKSMFVEEIAKEVGVKKVIVHAHSTGIDTIDEQKRNYEIKLHKETLQNVSEHIATDFWACSKDAAKFLFDNKIAQDKIVIMKNAINLEKFRFSEKIRDTYRRELGVGEDEILIGSVGRFAYPKNHEFLLRMFKTLCAERDNYKLVLVGDGDKKQEFIDYVYENSLQNKVIFTGFRKDVNYLLQAMDVFCLSSHFEGLGIVLIEAQAIGITCIASDTITKEVRITDCIDYLPLNEKLWVEKIKELKLKRRETSNYLIKEGYDIKTQIKKVESFYANC